MEKFRKILSEIKDNLGVITIIPLLLGGIWQVLSLMFISISYIRFFSVTQLISDGLLILTILILLLLTIRFGLFIVKDIVPRDNDTDKSKVSLLLNLFLTMIVSGIFGYYFVINFKEILKNEEINLFFLMIIIISLFLLLGIFFKCIFYIILIFTKGKLINLEKIRRLISSEFLIRIIGIFGICFLFISINGIIHFHKLYHRPKNLINIERVLNNYCVEKKIKRNSKINIQYFNDKYIFIQNNKDVEILKFDDFF